MSFIYKPTDKTLLDIRNGIFQEYAIPELLLNGFSKSPFSTGEFGRNNVGGFSYEFVRLRSPSKLELLVTHISKGDRYIKFLLNIFKTTASIASFVDIEAKEALKLHLPPLSLTSMRLRSDDYKFIPIITPLFYKEHKLGHYMTKAGFERRVHSLSLLVKEDCKNIDRFIEKWYAKHTVQQIDLG
jgi:hypothetical protein